MAEDFDLENVTKGQTKELYFQSNNQTFGKRAKAFETCMNTSLNAVLAYSAQISNRTYQKSIKNKIQNIRSILHVEEIHKKLRKDLCLRNAIVKKVVSCKSWKCKTINFLTNLQDTICPSQRNSFIVFVTQESTTGGVSKPVEKLKLSMYNDCLFMPTTSKSSLELTKLNDSSVSEEALMEMSSIYEKLFPAEKVISDSKYIRSINKVSEIHNCLLPTGFINIKNGIVFHNKEEWNKNLITKEMDTENTEYSKTNIKIAEGFQVLNLSVRKLKEDCIEEKEINKENDLVYANYQCIDNECLQNLLENTVILYCAATGVCQKKFTHYLNNLNVKHSFNWLKNHKP